MQDDSCYVQPRRRTRRDGTRRSKTRTWGRIQFCRFCSEKNIHYSAPITNYSNSVFASHEAADPVEERREEELDSSKLPREMPRQATVFI